MKKQELNFTMIGKKIKVLALLTVLIAFCACSKDGPAGPAGPAGTNSNVNVAQYTFGSRTITGSVTYTVPGITQTQMENSVILSYYKIGTGWYAAPGVGPFSDYHTRTILRIVNSNLDCYVGLITFTGAQYPTETVFSNFRVIIIPNSTNVTLARNGSKPDYTKMSYSEVCKFLKIDE